MKNLSTGPLVVVTDKPGQCIYSKSQKKLILTGKVADNVFLALVSFPVASPVHNTQLADNVPRWRGELQNLIA